MKNPRQIKVKYNGRKYTIRKYAKLFLVDKQSVCRFRHSAHIEIAYPVNFINIYYSNRKISLYRYCDGLGITYYLNNIFHRENGPAYIIKDNSGDWHYYYQFNQLHRLDGPAIFIPGHGIEDWYYNNRQINCGSQGEFERLIRLKEFW